MERTPLRFDRNELAGALGDLGTDLPLLVGMILVAGLDCASVLVMFGLMQVMTAWRYRMPMAVQPLKAVATMVIAGKLSGDLVYGAGLGIGLLMLVLTITGSLEQLARVVPRAVIRGLQLGLSVQLGSLALGTYIAGEGGPGLALAAVGFVITLLFLGNRKVPAALLLVSLGIGYALVFRWNGVIGAGLLGITLPKLHLVSSTALWQGFWLLALPQVPLSLGNSLLATQRVVRDLYPERRVRVTDLGYTYSWMNLINPFLGGVPTCHGAGGMVGHYTFGGRTGGSVFLYGSFYILAGLFVSGGFAGLVHAFPLPILGVLLLFEAIALMGLIRDSVQQRDEFFVVAVVGTLAIGLKPYGYLAGLVIGSLLVALRGRLRLEEGVPAAPTEPG